MSKSAKSLLIAVMLLSLTACSTKQVFETLSGPIDKRPPAQKAAEMATASAELLGSYVVVDSRKDVFSAKVERLNVVQRPEGIELHFFLKNNHMGTNYPLEDNKNPHVEVSVIGQECGGFAHSTGSTIFCWDVVPATSYFKLESFKNTERTIETETLFGSDQPMMVRSGDYLLEIKSKAPKQGFYLLRKQ